MLRLHAAQLTASQTGQLDNEGLSLAVLGKFFLRICIDQDQVINQGQRFLPFDHDMLGYKWNVQYDYILLDGQNIFVEL